MNFPLLFHEVCCTLKNRLLFLILFSAMFVIGIISGFVLDKPRAIECYYLSYCDNYVCRVYSQSPFRLFFDRIFHSFLFLLLAVPAALTVFFLPFQMLVVFYRGFIFGYVTVILFSVYRFGGFMVWLVVLLPQTLLFSALYIVVSALAFDCASENLRAKNLCAAGRFFRFLILAAIGVLLCAALEFLIVCIIFRPLSKLL